ncbi:MAG: PEGA domain-containing protein [Methanomicrobiales archaeon]
MSSVSIKWLFLLCFILALAVYSGHSFAADVNEKIGNRVDLKGTTISSDSIYLFVTGPDLPSNGVRLDNMQVPVLTGDPESFTVTDVTNDHWSFTWNTARQGFSLKEGIYTIYASKKPFGKSSVSSSVYGTISVSLTKSGEPYTSIGTAFINTTPIASEIFIDGQSVGNTPQTRGLTEGDHEIRLERPGYRTIIEKVSITPGSFVSIQKTMITEPIPEATTTLPSVTVFSIPSTDPITPVNPATTKKAQLSTPLIILSISVALIAMGIRKKP